jgi:hypothetical protein
MVSLDISNKGYASPYIKSDASFILKDVNNTYVFSQEDIDLRTFYTQETQRINSSLALDNVQSGHYCLYLQIGEEYSAIRLSNSGLWDETSRANRLTCDVIIK